jgi:pimeloyl-ACP methyl ester carboxylesterase
MTDASKPTVVLVHGAFADASGWSAVYRELTALGYPVYAPANPLRGVVSDSGYIRAFVSAIDGPVVLAGHSYGGCVITNASAGVAAVKALVYVAAFAPDEGETLSATFALGGGSTDLAKHLVTRPYPGAPDGDADGYIDNEHFHDLFCADVAPDLAQFMAAAQRGFALSCLSAPSGPPGWRGIPSWYMVAGNDATIPPEAERAMAARAGAVTAEVHSSHVAMISHPHEVTELIAAAANA